MPERVVILGGGFGGIGAARALKGADAEVMLARQHDYHTFQPLLYQVATDLLDMTAVGHPLRDLFHDQPNVTASMRRCGPPVDADAFGWSVNRSPSGCPTAVMSSRSVATWYSSG